MSAEGLRLAKLYSNITTCFKSTIVACATLHFYYTVTHFDEEIEYIWSRKWTIGKIMYLLTRYLGTIFLICSLVGVNTYAWNDSGYYTSGILDFVDEPPTLNNFFPTCFHGELFAGLCPMIILTAEVILQMRVCALYGNDKRLLAFFILLSVSLFGFNILQMSFLFLNIEANMCGSLGGCFNKRSTVSQRAFIPSIRLFRYNCLEAVPISGTGWAVTAFTEFLLFLLVIIKARKRLFKSPTQAMTHDIRASMARDSISYFAVLFTVYLTGAIIVFVFDYIDSDATTFLGFQMNSYETVAITATTILAPKLIIRLREESYGPSEVSAPQLSWNASVSEYCSSDGGMGSRNDADIGRSSDIEPEKS